MDQQWLSPAENKGTPFQYQGLPSRLGAVALGIGGTDMQVGMQVLGKSLQGYSCPQSPGSRKSLHQAFCLQNKSQQMSARCCLSCPSKVIQPEHALVLLIHQPVFNLQENFLPCSLQASLPVPYSLPSKIEFPGRSFVRIPHRPNINGGRHAVGKT